MTRISCTGLRALLLSTCLTGMACDETEGPDAGLSAPGDGGSDGASDASGGDGAASDSGPQQDAAPEPDAGDAGGGTATTSVGTRWRLWDTMNTTFAEHVLKGPDGERSNTVECAVSATQVEINLVDEGLDDSDQVIRPRSALQLQLDRSDDTVCSAAVTEAPYGSTPVVLPVYQDSCGGGCTFEVTVTEDASGLAPGFEVEGTVRCTEMKDGPLSTPLELASSIDLNTLERRPMAFHLVRCEAK